MTTVTTRAGKGSALTFTELDNNFTNLNTDKVDKVGAQTMAGALTAPGFIPNSSTVPTNGVFLPAANTLGFSVNSSEAARIDSSGRLLVGGTSSPSNIYSGTESSVGAIQIQTASGSGYVTNGLTLLNYSSSGHEPVITFGLSQSDTKGNNAAVASNVWSGYLNFTLNDGTNFRTCAMVGAGADGSATSGSTPGWLRFFTTPSGSTNATERMRINNSGIVGIGTATADVSNSGGPAAKLVVKGNVAVGPSDGSINGTTTYFYVGGDEAGTQRKIALAHVPIGLYGRGNLLFCVNDTSDGSNATTADEALRITDDKYLRMASGTGGIQFNGDSAAANALDDYEEGTWTPGVTFGGGSTGITYSSREGRYTKVGNVVFIDMEANLSNKGSSTGDARITGLPFSVNSSRYSNLIPRALGGGMTFTAPLYANAMGSDTTIAILDNNGGTQRVLTDTAFVNNTSLEITGFYYI